MTEEQRMLCEQNHNLIYRFLIDRRLEFNDYYDLAAIALCKAASTYDSEKGKFSTYAYKCMIYELHDATARKRQRIKYNIIEHSMDELIKNKENEESGNLEIPDIRVNIDGFVVLKESYKKALSKLNDKERTCIFYSAIGYNCMEISEILNISYSLTTTNLSRGRAKLRKELEL